ncbi:MAG: class I SAM-dependent methyltransferase [Flavobacteriaceae bacterium]|nr:class I SAM-dependent methyltransferase [Flavobacteriaceae bacterium]
MRDKGSFRDPSGYVFVEDDKIYRLVNKCYKDNFEKLQDSGLLKDLFQKELLVRHEIVKYSKSYDQNQYLVLDVEKIKTITYAYEWSFSQLKDAALSTLEIQLISVSKGMTLKDATPFNIQFKENKPIFIDTLSFEEIKDENYSWKPYKQFCENFLSPLVLMSYTDPRLNKILMNDINGIPIDLSLKLIPLIKKFIPSIFIHFVLPSLFTSKKKSNSDLKSKKISKSQHLSIINQLIDFISSLKLHDSLSEWGDYYNETVNEKKDYVINKEKLLKSFTEGMIISTTWDIGSNDGFFSSVIANSSNSYVYSLDIDWRSVEYNYLRNKKNKTKNIHPIIFDFSNPTPALGWLNIERKNLFERLDEPDLIMCLALMHHVINANIPFDQFINFLKKTNKYVIIEYIPFNDPKCQEIYKTRKEEIIYPTEKEFINLISESFKVILKGIIEPTERKLFLIEKK